MRKFLLTAFIAIVSLINITTVNAFAVNNILTAESFKTVNVGVPAKIRIYQGDEFSIGIRATDNQLQNLIKYEVTDSTLNIWLDSYIPENIYNINSEDIRIAIVVPNEVNIKTKNSSLVATSRTYKKKTTSYEKD